MIWQNTKVRIAIIASLVLLAIIAYRIYGNIQANNERANRVCKGRILRWPHLSRSVRVLLLLCVLRAALILFGRPTWQLK